MRTSGSPTCRGQRGHSPRLPPFWAPKEADQRDNAARLPADGHSRLWRAPIDDRSLAAACRGELHPRAQLARAPASHRNGAAGQPRARGGRRAHLPRLRHRDAGLHLSALHPAAEVGQPDFGCRQPHRQPRRWVRKPRVRGRGVRSTDARRLRADAGRKAHDRHGRGPARRGPADCRVPDRLTRRQRLSGRPESRTLRSRSMRRSIACVRCCACCRQRTPLASARAIYASACCSKSITSNSAASASRTRARS